MTEPIRHLYLDLEDTVITPVMDGWFRTEMINAEKVKAFINEFKPDQVHLFSFAIWNETEKTRFNKGTRPMLEKALGIELAWVPTVDGDIIPICCNVMGMGMGSVNFMEMSNFWGKQQAFRLCMLHKWKSGSTPVEVVLLDDVVYNEFWEWPDIKVKGRILNIDQL